MGDAVLLINSASKVGESKKLQPIWLGPYLITEKLSPVTYRLVNRKREWVVHYNRLKLCLDDELPIWLRRRRDQVREPHNLICHEGDLGLKELFRQGPEKNTQSLRAKVTVGQTPSPIPVSVPSPLPDLDTDHSTPRTPQAEFSRRGRRIKRPSHLREFKC